MSTIQQIPWVEKYRPSTMDDILQQEHIKEIMNGAIHKNLFPHLLFYGPPGTGKTTTISVIAKKLYGNDLENNILELNASNDRSIDIIRRKIKTFAKNMTDKPFKIIVLDEADSMTSSSQAALRRIIEKYSNNTRFCIICNYLSYIKDPIKSRCLKLRFYPFDKLSIHKQLKFIAQKEKIQLTDLVCHALTDFLGTNDLRKIITYFQNIVQICGKNKLTVESIEYLVSKIDLGPLWESVLTGELKQILKAVDELIYQGFSVDLIIKKLMMDLLSYKYIDERNDFVRASVIKLCADIEVKIMEGSDEKIQLTHLVYFLTLELEKIRNN